MRRLSRLLTFCRRRWPLVVVHVVLVAVGIMFVAIGLDMWNAQRPIESGVVTTGRVVGHAVKEYTDQDGHRQTARYPIIEFRDHREAAHRLDGDFHGFERDTGDVVPVRYDPHRPSRAQLVDQPGRWVWMVFAGGGAVAWVVELGIVLRHRSVARALEIT